MSEFNLTQYDFRPDEAAVSQKIEPELLRGLNEPTSFDPDRFIQVLREATETYTIVEDRRGVKHERIVFNAGEAGLTSILEGPTSFTGVRRNPGNMLETGVAATLNPNASFDYITPHNNHPTGPMRQKDFWHLLRTGRYTYGLGTSELPYRALDSLLDLVELYSDNDLPFPTHVRGDSEGARLAAGLRTAYGNIRGSIYNGIDGVSPDAKTTSVRITQNVISRWQRQHEDDAPGSLSPAHIKEVKRLMSPAVYGGFHYYEHLAPIPAVLHPAEFAKAAAMNIVGFKHHSNQNDLANHAVYQDLRASIFASDGPSFLLFGAKSRLHKPDDCLFLAQALVDGLPEDKRTPNRLVRVVFIDEAGDFMHTDKPLARPALERYGFPDIKYILGLILGGLVEVLPAETSHSPLDELAG